MQHLHQKRPTFIPLYLLSTKKDTHQALSSYIKPVQQGHAEHAATHLRAFLHAHGIDNLHELQYGPEIPVDLRKAWRLAGIDPDSANEVYEYLARNASDPNQMIGSLEEPDSVIVRNRLGYP
ncbi:MAG: hypothetical protein JSS07_09220 [Proteobacteria bacterium]|nr:hypothetical protein [Pseudomonadota bacterium]